MIPSLPENEIRRIYLDALERAVRHAAVHVSREEALEIGHHIATALVRREGRQTGEQFSAVGSVRDVDAFIHRSVLNRLREIFRSRRRRAAAEESYGNDRTAVAPAWTQPDARLESRELHRIIEMTVEAMPEMRRQVFLLVRRDQRSYKEVAAQLGIGIGTVHTHLSRANAALRQAVAEFREGRSARPSGFARTIGTAT